MAVGQRRANRPVDQAMVAGRVPKDVVRSIWMEAVAHHAALTPDLSQTLYLTLPGAEGIEIELLKNAGLIKTTETGAIAAKYAHRIVGIENSSTALMQIARKYPGFKVIRGTVDSYLRGTTLTKYPDGESEAVTRARVVNLDLNETWRAVERQNEEWLIPVQRWIQKFSLVHAKAPKIPWTLLLTLHGECPWENHAAQMREAFLESVDRIDGGQQRVAEWLGHELFNRITAEGFTEFHLLSRIDQQIVLMWLVPILIAGTCIADGWDIHVANCLRYGTLPNAPMVTWRIDFIPPPQVPRLAHTQAHRRCVESLLATGEAIEENGTIVIKR